MLNSGAPGPSALEKGTAPFGLLQVPRRRGRRAFAQPPPRYPDFGPRPASAARPPRPAPGPRWRQRSVTAPLLSFLRSAPCQKGEALLHRWGRGRGLQPGGARVRGDPREGGGWGGRRGGGEVARRGCGRGGEPHSGSRRLLPAPASTFCTAQRGTCPRPLGSCHGLHREGRAAELGTGSPKQPAPHRAEANLAARPAPQPFSRGSRRGGGCGGGSRSCCRCSTTCPFACARRTACPAPPPHLRSFQLHRDPEQQHELLLPLRPLSIPHFPSPHLPTAGEVRAVSTRVLRPTDSRGPPSGQHHSRPRRQFLHPVPHSPDLLPQSTK